MNPGISWCQPALDTGQVFASFSFLLKAQAGAIDNLVAFAGKQCKNLQFWKSGSYGCT
jgi:hypothetical protein